jgi:hypothetical protein
VPEAIRQIPCAGGGIASDTPCPRNDSRVSRGIASGAPHPRNDLHSSFTRKSHWVRGSAGRRRLTPRIARRSGWIQRTHPPPGQPVSGSAARNCRTFVYQIFAHPGFEGACSLLAKRMPDFMFRVPNELRSSRPAPMGWVRQLRSATALSVAVSSHDPYPLPGVAP